MTSDVIPATPSTPPSSLSRLLRPNRWRLWIQFLILGGLILIIPILLTSYQLLHSSRQVLIEHEIVDLSDEANLRVNEMREDMAYLARDVRLSTAKHEREAPGVAVRSIFKGVGLPQVPDEGQPATIRDARRKLLHGCAIGAYALRSDPNGGVEIIAQMNAEGEPANESPARTLVLKECLNELIGRVRRPAPVDRSGLHLQAAEGNRPARTLLAFGVRPSTPADSPLVYAYVIDFSRYIRNRQSTSPRHFYFVTDPAGRVLIHPRPSPETTGRNIADLVPWKYPKDEAGSWFMPAPDETARHRRLARVVRDGGSRLPAAEAPALTFYYSKGNFPGGKPLEQVLPDPVAASAAVLELNRSLRRELEADPELRCGELSTGFAYIEVSHPRAERLQAVQSKVDEWIAAYTGGNSAKWTRPLECHSLQGQLVPMRVDLNDQDDPAWLIVGASIEELQEDIDDRFNYVGRVWVFPTLAFAMACGFALVFTLTYSLGQLAKAAKRLSDGKEVSIPLHGPYEVSQLALTLDELARRVQIRDRELRERAARYETILRAAGEGIVICSAAGIIEEANKAAGRMFGYPSEQLIGMPVTSFVASAQATNDPSFSVEALTTFSSSLEAVKGRRRDATTFWLEMNLRPVALKDRMVITCIFRDVTLRKEAEGRIHKMNDELESRVKIRTAELEEANCKLDVALKQAEAASLAKDVFVANMSHELRQPLNIITGFTQVLIEEAGDLGAQTIIPDLNKILTAANHLLELINDILDLAKIAAGRMDLTLSEFDVSKLVRDVEVLVGPLATVNENRFRIEMPDGLDTMKADERRVRQILINLLSNAFKFTAGGEVTLKVQSFKEAGRAWVQFRVRDTGKGMSPEQLGRLFQRFYQADSSTTREQAGTGLGLTITQSFCELMGGQPIHVTSEEGKGSEFIVTLPAVVEKSKAPAPKPAELALTTGIAAVIEANDPGPIRPEDRKVLVIEDDPMIRELMSRFLGKEGFHVVLATNGDEGIRLAQTLRPSVITLDVTMPGVDGWTVLANLKTHESTCDIPVVMLTIVDDRGRGFALGAADYLTKPIDWQRLGAILRKFISSDRHDVVLVIDDDANNREIIRRAVEREGCTIVEAADGEHGLRAFAECRPALVLLDLMMPVLDGFGFLDELAKRFPAHKVPVVVLTAKVLTPQDFQRLNGRVARILEKGDLSNLESLLEIVRSSAKG